MLCAGPCVVLSWVRVPCSLVHSIQPLSQTHFPRHRCRSFACTAACAGCAGPALLPLLLLLLLSSSQRVQRSCSRHWGQTRGMVMLNIQNWSKQRMRSSRMQNTPTKPPTWEDVLLLVGVGVGVVPLA